MANQKRNSPGRYYAACVLKLVLGHILLEYDIKKIDGMERNARIFYWRSARVPRSDAVVLIRKRA